MHATNDAQRQALWHARLEIEGLRHRYAVATDKLAHVNDPAAQTRGEAIYQRIFTRDARMQVAGSNAPDYQAQGPHAWAEVVRGAIGHYAGTQHLIGSQTTRFEQVDFDANDRIAAGSAHLWSSVQAWHNTPDARLRLVLGTYLDRVVFTPGIGWQIHTMRLEYTASEARTLT